MTAHKSEQITTIYKIAYKSRLAAAFVELKRLPLWTSQICKARSQVTMLAVLTLIFGVANVPSHAFKKIPPTASQGGRSSFNFSGKWYGGGGTYTISQQAINVVIRSEGEYSTTWAGIVSGNKINGSWSCSRANQKGTFSFTYNPNYQKGYMERISGTYYIEDKWGKDPRDFYADRKIQR